MIVAAVADSSTPIALAAATSPALTPAAAAADVPNVSHASPTPAAIVAPAVIASSSMRRFASATASA